MTEQPRETGVRAIDRAVAILTSFQDGDGDVGISEIARRTGLSTSTTQRLLVAMTAHDLVRQAPSGRYRLGGLPHLLAARGTAAGGLRDAAVPHLTALRDRLDETVAVHEYAAPDQRIVLAQVESRQQLRRTYTDIGIPSRVVHGAPGKAIMCCLEPRTLDAVLADPIERITSRTITDETELRQSLVDARVRGWATSDSERTQGIASFASPVFDLTGSVVGSINVSVPDSRVDADRGEVLGVAVRATAWSVSADLGADRDLVQRRWPDLALG